MNMIDTDNLKVTPEMEANFKQYLQGHVHKVCVFAKMLFELGLIERDLYDFIRHGHDKSKLEEPEFTPYVKRKWFEREGDQEKFNDMGDDVKQAIIHHVTNNSHHPECWSPDYEGFEVEQPCHIVGMPEECVIEMVCDWMAMGLERGNTARAWYNKVNGSKWMFDKTTQALIEKWLATFENMGV